MAKSKKTSATARKHAPFTDRVTNKITKLQTWVGKTAQRFASAPKSDVADSLGAMNDSIDAILEALPKLNGWAPTSRGASFAVGDSVSFKPKKLEELVKAGFYSKGTLDGEHEIEAIAGRKVKLACGVFQSLYVTKS